MRVAVFEAEPWECRAFEKLRPEFDLNCFSEPLTATNAPCHADADIISIFIYSRLDSWTLKQLKKLKLIATRSTGYDHIDMDYCRENGITVCNVPVYGSYTVAEHVFGLILMICHRLYESIDRTRKGDFSQKGLTGFDIRGKTLGVIGTGLIGRHVIEIARGFRMEVAAYDPRPDTELAARLGFVYAGLDEVLGRSDVISLHVPANRQTFHMLSTEQFSKMKDGVVLINTARGNLVDIEALLHALADGKVSAAGLDVLPEEPVIREEAELLSSFFHRAHDMSTLLANHILLRMRNVYITPHNAFNTREAVERILATTTDNIRAFTRGEPLNVVVSKK